MGVAVLYAVVQENMAPKFYKDRKKMLDSPIDDRQLLELRDVVTQTLTCTGVLGKYKAQLRASVYDVLHGRPRGEVYFENSRLGAIKTNEESKFEQWNFVC